MKTYFAELFEKDREEALAKKEAEVTAKVKAEATREIEANSKQMLKTFALTLAADGQPVQKISLYTKLSEDEVRMILAEQSPEYQV